MSKTDLRILSYIRKNAKMDLETTDLVFHLRLDEDIVRESLKRLIKQKKIIYENPEKGSVYWYPAPVERAASRPSTRIPQAKKAKKTPSTSISDQYQPSSISYSIFIPSIIAVVLFAIAAAWIISTVLTRKSSSEYANKGDLGLIVKTIKRQQKFDTMTKAKMDSLHQAFSELKKENQELKAQIEKLEKEVNQKTKSSRRRRRR
jgi:flagellar basal body-associated protein FliL